MTKTMKNAIKIRSRLKNVLIKLDLTILVSLKNRDKSLYKIVKKKQKRVWSKINSKLVSVNEKFRQTIQPYFFDKGNFPNKKMIAEKKTGYFHTIENYLRLKTIGHSINVTKTLYLKPSINSSLRSSKIIGALNLLTLGVH